MPAASNRPSIKPFLLTYVQQFAEQELGTDDVTEAVNQIILDHRRGNCSKVATANKFSPSPAIAIAPVVTGDESDEDFLDSLEAGMGT